MKKDVNGVEVMDSGDGEGDEDEEVGREREGCVSEGRG